MARILVMEDDEDQAALLRIALDAEGHTVTLAHTGTEAYEACLYASPPYDLLITDILVRMDGQIVSDGGVSLIGKLRTANDGRPEWFLTLPIIAITGVTARYPSGNYLEIAKGLGANELLRKPIDLETLSKTVNTLLGAQHPPQPHA